MRQYLPSKKYFIVLLCFLTLAGSFYAYRKYNEKRAALLSQNKNDFSELPEQLKSDKDSDGDGLLDWEESIYKTKYKVADTDNDGTPDGQEINERRDPLVPGPNDYIRAIGNPGQELLTSKEDLTETEKMMRGMLSVIGRVDNPSDPRISESLAQTLLNKINQKSKELPNSFSFNDLRTVPETKESLKTYGTTLGTVLSRYEEPGLEEAHLLSILARALKDHDEKALKDLEELKTKKIQKIADLKKIPVPEDLVILHIALLNIEGNSLPAMDNLGFVIADPLRGLIGIKQYKAIAEETLSIREGIRAHISNAGVVFSEKDPALSI